MTFLAAEMIAVMNEGMRVGGFSPVQWALRQTQRYGAGEQHNDKLAGQIEWAQERIDPTTIFAERAMVRREAKKSFVHTDSSKRVAKALLRKAAPKTDEYQVGDLMSFQREQGAGGIKCNRWPTPSRIIGFEHSGKVCCAICEGVPFCLATDKLFPANDAQALVYKLMHEGEDRMPPEQQQSYIDA